LLLKFLNDKKFIGNISEALNFSQIFKKFVDFEKLNTTKKI